MAFSSLADEVGPEDTLERGDNGRVSASLTQCLFSGWFWNIDRVGDAIELSPLKLGANTRIEAQGR